MSHTVISIPSPSPTTDPFEFIYVKWNSCITWYRRVGRIYNEHHTLHIHSQGFLSPKPFPKPSGVQAGVVMSTLSESLLQLFATHIYNTHSFSSLYLLHSRYDEPTASEKLLMSANVIWYSSDMRQTMSQECFYSINLFDQRMERIERMGEENPNAN